MKALDISAPNKTLSNLLPILTVIFLDSFSQLLVLFGRPVSLVCAILVLGRPRLVDGGVCVLASDDHLLGCLVELLFARARIEHPGHQRRLIRRHSRFAAYCARVSGRWSVVGHLPCTVHLVVFFHFLAVIIFGDGLLVGQ